jgi:hypothetical protein
MGHRDDLVKLLDAFVARSRQSGDPPQAFAPAVRRGDRGLVNSVDETNGVDVEARYTGGTDVPDVPDVPPTCAMASATCSGAHPIGASHWTSVEDGEFPVLSPSWGAVIVR